ncbi:MAG: glycosyltransferase family 4 protein, partial [Ignavibacteriaceae bacterium]
DLNTFNSIQMRNDWREKNNFDKNDFLLIYAGILGYAQGLEVIIYAAEKLKNYSNIKFLIFGDGPEKSNLMLLRNQLNLTNIYFFQPVSKNEIRQIIKSMDAAIIPLKKIELFKGAIPSKILEILTLERPILLGVNGEARDLFINSGKCGLYFEPENFESLSENILRLYESEDLLYELGKNGNNYIKNNFNSEKIAEDFWKLLHSNS